MPPLKAGEEEGRLGEEKKKRPGLPDEHVVNSTQWTMTTQTRTKGWTKGWTKG
jgi:hypothetical protein